MRQIIDGGFAVKHHLNRLAIIAGMIDFARFLVEQISLDRRFYFLHINLIG